MHLSILICIPDNFLQECILENLPPCSYGGIDINETALQSSSLPLAATRRCKKSRVQASPVGWTVAFADSSVVLNSLSDEHHQQQQDHQYYIDSNYPWTTDQEEAI